MRHKYHFPAEDDLLCGCDSFRALVDTRDACSKCRRLLDDLLHALCTTANQADYSGYDKRTVRAIELAFRLRAQAAGREAES